MKFLRFFVCIVFLVSSVLPFTARAQSSENIVLLPLLVPPSLQSKRDIYAAAIQNALREKFNVFYGPQVEEALRREMAKKDCSAESCVHNIAVEFNGEIVVDAVIDQLGSSYVLSIKFNNVITGELEEGILSTCDDCSENALFKFVQQQALSADLNPESGLTALLDKTEQGRKPAEEQGKLNDLARTFEKSENPEPQPEPQKEEIIVVPQQSAKRKAPSADFAREKEGLSWWVYGLPLLALGGGGGGGGGGGDTSVGSAPTPTPTPTPDPTPDPLPQIEGDVVKGPLRGATVFLDYNDNGALDTGEPFTLTDNNGSYSFQVENANAAIVVVTDENTVDTSSGEVMSGLVLKAPQGSTVITPVTTLFADGDMTEAEVKASLGIAAEVDIKSFNPFKAESGSQVAVKLEKLALQIVSSANAIAKVAQDEGVDQFEASKRAFASIIESIEEKSDNGEQFDFTVQDDLTKIREKAESELSALITFDADKRTALRGAMETAKSTIETIENLTALDDEASQNIFRSAARIKGEIDNRKSTDSDNDGIPDFIDFDRDNDGVEDFADLFPEDGSESSDLDGDGVGDNSDPDRDGDGVANGSDVFPDDSAETADLDGDGTGDKADLDRDGDGVANNQDLLPDDGSETADSDGDGVGDNADAFPNNRFEWRDVDGDGVGDNRDLFVGNPNEWSDKDSDGNGDNSDDAYNAAYWFAFLEPNSEDRFIVLSESGRLAMSAENNEHLPYINEQGLNVKLSTKDSNGFIDGEETLALYKFQPFDFFGLGDSYFSARASDNAFFYAKLGNDPTYFGEIIYLDGRLTDDDGNVLNAQPETIVGSPSMRSMSYGVLKYDHAEIHENAFGTVSLAQYSGDGTRSDAFLGSRGLVNFKGNSVGLAQGMGEDEYFTTSDVDIYLDFPEQEFLLISSNTKYSDTVGSLIGSDLSDFDFSVEGTVSDNGYLEDNPSTLSASRNWAIELRGRLYSISGDQAGGAWFVKNNNPAVEDEYVAAFGAYNSSSVPRQAAHTSERSDDGLYAVNSRFFNGSAEDQILRIAGETQIKLGGQLFSLEDEAVFNAFDTNQNDLIDFNWSGAPNLKRFVSNRYSENPEIALGHIINEEDEIMTSLDYFSFGVVRYDGKFSDSAANNVDVRKTIAFADGSLTPYPAVRNRGVNFTGSSVGVFMGDYLPNGQDFYYTKSEVRLFANFPNNEFNLNSRQTQGSNCISGCGFAPFNMPDFNAMGHIDNAGNFTVTHLHPDSQIKNTASELPASYFFSINPYGENLDVMGGTWHFQSMNQNHHIFAGDDRVRAGAQYEYIAAFGVFED